MTCPIPGMCSRSPTCADRNCPGHPCPDAPVTTPEEAQDMVLSIAVTVAVFLFCVFCAVALLGAPIVLPFN